MNRDNQLQLVQALATYSPAEDVELDISEGREVTERERLMAKALNDIYMAVHSFTHLCPHAPWQRKAYEQFDYFNKNKLL